MDKKHTKETHDLEYFIGIADKYKITSAEAIIKYGEILEGIMHNYPKMSADWYVYEADRRLKQYAKEKGIKNETK